MFHPCFSLNIIPKDKVNLLFRANIGNYFQIIPYKKVKGCLYPDLLRYQRVLIFNPNDINSALRQRNFNGRLSSILNI